jgi:hypothetical protein
MRDQLMAKQIELAVFAIEHKLQLPNGEEPLELLKSIAEILGKPKTRVARRRKKEEE